MTIVPFTGFISGIEDICLIDRGTTHTELKDRKYFSYLKMRETNANTTSDSGKLIESSGRDSIFLSRGTIVIIHELLFFSKS
jgi:hypothetical protein